MYPTTYIKYCLYDLENRDTDHMTQVSSLTFLSETLFFPWARRAWFNYLLRPPWDVGRELLTVYEKIFPRAPRS